MTIYARYTQLSLAAKQWQELAAFYTSVFGCVPVVVEHEYQEPALATERELLPQPSPGMHLRLPGYGSHGPTLAIYHDPENAARARLASYGPRLVFTVADVGYAQACIEAAGGATRSSATVQTLANGMRLTCGFAADPEGNIIELQSWEYEPSAMPAPVYSKPKNK